MFALFVSVSDGTWSDEVYLVNVGGGGGSTIDRELVVSTYRCKTAFTGASVGDSITATQIIDVSGETPSTVSTVWRNQTTAADLASAPAAAVLELVGSTALTDAQLTVSIGAQADVAAPADGVGDYGLFAALKRGLLNWAELLGRIPAAITPGLMPVDTLGTPGTPRVQATSAAAAPIVLTATCRRVSMHATQGTWYSISGAATNTSHYIGAGERLDFAVPANTTISVLQETTVGSVRITELA